MMNKKLLAGLLVIAIGVIGIVIVLANENALIVHPKGVIAKSELELIILNIALMLLIIVPTYILLFSVVWKYCIKKNGKYDPDHSYGPIGELIMWLLPSFIVAIMAIVTWDATHKLNPYKPLESEVKPLIVQVIALDWKWLFIYPEQGIATLNYFSIPADTPIHLRLTADGSPMNSFWIPQLSGQIYSMTGMSTQLYLMSDEPGEYAGRAVEINGEGYADMTFIVKSTSPHDFEDWIAEVKKSSIHLTEEVYEDLVKPSVNKSIILFSEVEEGLYHKVIHKYMYPTQPVL
jgi:cytochrome o ubiquinol oxidase subunit 2